MHFNANSTNQVQRFKGSKVDAYKPSGHSITHTIQCTILCKEETKKGQKNYMKCLACTKISSLPPANNSKKKGVSCACVSNRNQPIVCNATSSRSWTEREAALCHPGVQLTAWLAGSSLKMSLSVLVKSATNLPNVERVSKSDPLCAITLKSKAVCVVHLYCS